MRALLLRLLDHPRASWLAVALALLLAAPALGGGLGADDWFHRAHLDPAGSFYPASRGPILDLFAFFPADPAALRRLVDAGILPWWTQPDVRGAFLRPLTAVTHWVDWRVFGEAPVIHHAHSLAWLAAAVLAANALFREWLGRGRAAVLATILFAVDESHALPAAWVANRNALLAMAFGALAARAHLQAMRGVARARVLAALWLAAALLSAEAGVSTLALLFVFEVGHREGVAARVRRLAPLFAVTLAWALTWVGLGFGMHGSGLYVDPVGDPLRFLRVLPERLGTLSAAAWLNAPVDGWILLNPSVATVAGLGLGAATVLALVALLRRDWPSSRVPGQAVLLATLALIPPTGAFPMTRVVGLAGLGVAAAIAVAVLPSLEGPTGRRRDWLALAWHLPLAGLALAVQTFGLGYLLAGTTAAADALDDAEAVEERTLVLTSGHEIMTAYIPVVRHYTGRAPPRAMVTLAPVGASVRLTREDAHTLLVEAVEPAFAGAFERLARTAPFVEGERTHNSNVASEVLEVGADGSLKAWRLRFPAPLEDPRYLWRRPDGLALVPFSPPAPGAFVDLDAPLAPPWANAE